MKQWIKYILSVAIIGILVWLDQFTKELTIAHLKEKPLELIPGVFELTYVENRGSAFGMMQGQFTFFYIMTGIVLAALIYTIIRTPFHKRYGWMLSVQLLLFSGAVGNLIDRVFRGFVVDMLYFKLIDFPVFNVADCYVTVSCVLLFILLSFVYTDEELDVYVPKKNVTTQKKES